ncbi:MAG TPA: 1-acyl-sn-glycerol-3-phosphate acyltransferase [Pseudonocardiaceae bacterium]|nr:1-acyl-sn-glycerol-3-phosphate acyltransferase [Pseudonocardiaceae bacterium]
MTALRRAVTIPVLVAIEVLVLGSAPLLVALAVVVGAYARSSRPLRSVLLVITYFALELRTLARIRRGPDDWDVLVRDTLSTAYRALRTILDVPLVLTDDSTAPGANPVVVLARHCGPGDSLFIAWLLAVRFRMRPHIVLKSLLRVEPVIDLAGDHLPLCFVGFRHRTRNRIADLAAGMSAGDALLLFPEGRNFSRQRWLRTWTDLVARGARRAARRMRRHTHTLPPHHGGAYAALSAAPHADVLLLAHGGFTEDGRDRPWWRLPVHRPFVVRTTLVPAASVPRTEEALGRWLDGAWADVDRWVEYTVDDVTQVKFGANGNF